jgi:predicted DNA-binding transcriptional regulator YafY
MANPAYRPKGNGTQARRCIRLLRLLERESKVNLEEFAAELGVSERTIKRDIRVLIDAGEPVVRFYGATKGWQLRFSSPAED